MKLKIFWDFGPCSLVKIDRSTSSAIARMMGAIGTNETAFRPNAVVEWLTHLLRIREVPGSDLCPETG
jgi:hypothetical protein